MFETTNVLLTCACGTLPLSQAQHRTAQSAWAAAAQHVALNPTKCNPSLTRVSVPLVLSV